MKDRIFIIGCGGVGSWLAPSLCLLTSPSQITLIDGDVLEEKNLNRQLFSSDEIGMKKAEALAQRYGCNAIPKWYSFGLIEHVSSDWLMVAVDNNPARMAALKACDMFGCNVIVAANETLSSEAYFYNHAWKGTALDPRVYYPELVTDRSGDPQSARIGCTGEVQRNNRQLVSANFSAAALAQNLFVCHAMEAPSLDQEVIQSLPYKLVSNLSKLESFKINQKKGQL